jgi:hypothetical protein
VNIGLDGKLDLDPATGNQHLRSRRFHRMAGRVIRPVNGLMEASQPGAMNCILSDSPRSSSGEPFPAS